MDNIIHGTANRTAGETFPISYKYYGSYTADRFGTVKNFGNTELIYTYTVPSDANTQHSRLACALQKVGQVNNYYQFNVLIGYLGNDGQYKPGPIPTFNTTSDIEYWGDDTRDFSSIGGILENIRLYYTGSWRPGDAAQSVIDITYIINMGMPVFENQNDLTNYVLTGDDSRRIDGGSEPEVPSIGGLTNNNYYIDSTIYSCDSRGQNRVQIAHNRAEYYIIGSGTISGYLDTTQNPYNITLQTNANEFQESINGGSWVTRSTFSVNNQWGDGGLWNKNNLFWYVVLDTNIKIRKNKQQSDEDLQDDDSDGTKIIVGGEEITSTEINGNVFGSTEFTTTHVLNHTQLRSIANVFYNEDSDVVNQIIEGLKYYGSNPIESVIDLYAMPIDPEQFYDCAVQQNVQFGLYSHNVGDHKVTFNSGKTVELFNSKISRVFNDWRDYKIAVQLFLPFVGIFNLNASEILGHTLKILCGFDIHAHVIKYWLFIDGIISETHENSIGVQFPIIASDSVGKAQHNINTTLSTTSKVVETVISPSSPTQDISSVGGSVLGDMVDYLMHPQADKTISGSFSSNMSAYDTLYPYLTMTIPSIIYPKSMVDEFGKPSLKFEKLGNNTGYFEASNVQYISDLDVDIQNEVLTILKNGVVNNT